MKLSNFIALIFVLAVMVATSILVNIYGWGLQPKNWWWIIGVGLFWNVFARFIGDKVIEEGKKK